jgi:hypothetical protein
MRTKVAKQFFQQSVLVLVVLCSAFAGQLNVALNKPAYVKYTGARPNNTDNANPANVVDGNYATWLTIDGKSSGFDNTGTSITINLGSDIPASRMRILMPFLQLNPMIRVQGYQVWASSDSSVWNKVLDIPDNQLPSPDTTFVSPQTGKFWKLIVTKVDDGANQCAIAEIELYADISFPTITSVVISDTTMVGRGYKNIRWSSMNMAATDQINISYKPAYSNDDYFPAASNILNSGTFSWLTDTLADGDYTVRVAPAASGQVLSCTAKATIANYLGLKLMVANGYHYSYAGDYSESPASDWYWIDFAPPFFSQFFGDSIHLAWNFAARQSGEISYSCDSMRTWIPLAAITDTAQRNCSLPCPLPSKSSLCTFFRISVLRYNKIMASAVSVQIIVSALPNGVSLRWSKPDTAYRSSSMPSLLSYVSNGKQQILLGDRWVVNGKGDSVTGFGSRRSWNALGYAVGDLDNSGNLKLVTFNNGSLVISAPEGTVSTLPVGTSNANPLHLIDIDADQKREIVVDDYNYGVSAFHLDGKAINPLGNRFSHAAVADFDGDGQQEIALILTATNELALCSLNGAMKKGFPVKIYDALETWILSEDLDMNGKPVIIFAGANHLYAFNGDGSMHPGYPVLIKDFIDDTYPAVADINNDGRLEIILTAHSGYTYAQYYAAQAPQSVLYVVGANGGILSPWPVALNCNYLFPYTITNTTAAITQSVPLLRSGSFSSPLIASIDGGKTPEILITSDNGFLYVFSNDGKLRDGYPVYLACSGRGLYPYDFSGSEIETGVLGDFDGDGSLNFVIHSYPDSLEDNGRIVCLDFGPGSYNATATPWPMFLQNPERTGIAPKPFFTSANSGGAATAQANFPNAFTLSQNYPNPFNPTTNITYSIKERCEVRLTVFDIVGRAVATIVDGMKEPGYYLAGFDASQLSSGIYIYKLQAGNYVSVKKMIVQK